LIFFLFFFTFNNFLLTLVTFLFNLVTPIYEITSSTYSATVIPNEIRGRVTSLTRIAVLSAYSFGLFAMGTMLEKYGVNTSIAVFAGVLFLLSLITIFNKSLKQIKQPQERLSEI
jgi:predicted MFS family arabinose efflux permease